MEPTPSFEDSPTDMQIIGINEFLKDEGNIQEAVIHKQRLTETQNRDGLRKISLRSNEKLPTIHKLEYWEMTPSEELFYEENILNKFLQRKKFFYKV